MKKVLSISLCAMCVLAANTVLADGGGHAKVPDAGASALLLAGVFTVIAGLKRLTNR